MPELTTALMLAYAGDKIIVPFVNKLLGAYTDDIKALFSSRAKRLFGGSEQMLTSAEIEPQQVDLKVLKPIVEGAVLEEDESLANKWAALLANAATPQGDMLVESSFADVLRQLTSLQARVLDELYKQVDAARLQDERGGYQPIDVRQVRQDLELSFATFERCIDNLVRMKLCNRIIPARSSGLFKSTPSYTTTEPTLYGHAFVTACKPPVKS